MRSDRSLDAASADAPADPADQIRDLQRAVDRCEQQLRVREEVIRRLRYELQAVRALHQRPESSTTHRVARRLGRLGLVRRSWQLAATVRQRLPWVAR